MFSALAIGIVLTIVPPISDPAPGFSSPIAVPVGTHVRTSTPESLDFWVGTWDCTGKSRNPNGDGWTETKCMNHIDKILDDKVIHENFDGPGMKGQSWSVFSPKTNQWHQTWVDNQGGYIDLIGGIENGNFVLKTLPNSKRPKASNRMVFSDITSNSFTWTWEGTKDGGKSWTAQWILNYKRHES